MSTTIQEVLATDEMIDELLAHGTVGGCDSLAQLRQENYAKKALLDGRSALEFCDGRERTYGGFALTYGMNVVELERSLYDELVKQLQIKLENRGNGSDTRLRVSPLYYEIVRFEP